MPKQVSEPQGCFLFPMEVIPTDLFLPSQTTERVIEETSETLLLSEEDIYFGVEEVVVTSQPDENAHTSALTTGPAPHASTLTTRPAPHASTLKTRPASHASDFTTRPAPHASTLTTRPATHASTLTTRPAPHASTLTTRPAPHAFTFTTGPAPHASTLTTGPPSLPSTSTAEQASIVRFSDLIEVPTTFCHLAEAFLQERGERRG
ncbi:uncharacterized protein [Paramisgurnus dabryanus]|uniref:uncharacterized protein n=1 Tax=Paramisgurnus dabryanus TaxID=90735 RepID=UPI0031F35D2D